MDGRLNAGHSPEFVAAWRGVFCDVYRWRQDGRFAVVPSLLGAPTFAYLPGLDYADLNVSEAQELAREMAGRSFNIRTLTLPRGEPPPGSPVVLRVDLAAFGHQRDNLWERALNRKRRNAVRRARKAGLVVSEEGGVTARKTSFDLIAATLSRHGAPCMPAVLFERLVDEFNVRTLIVRDTTGEALGSLLWLRDGRIACVAWVGWHIRPDNPASLLFWMVLEQSLCEGVDIVDFGRSPTGGGSYRFKRSFGAVPIPVVWLSDKATDLYRRYALAQKLWRGLPDVVTARLGPRLCRYLANY